jgi:hypothetical protein
MMEWKKTSDYSISNGRFYIAKALVMGEPKFTLWDNAKIVGTWDTAQEAKNHAKWIEIHGGGIPGTANQTGCAKCTQGSIKPAYGAKVR